MYLNVPYTKKDEANKLGTKWDIDKKQWYIPQVDSALFTKWRLPNFKTKSQEIVELHEKIAQQDEAFDSLRHKFNTAQDLLESREASYKGAYRY
nr:DUF5710 domain-containing protein [Helicobacter sp.]